MHGLINRSIQCFTRDTYGPDAWTDVAERAGLRVPSFEAMQLYEDAITHAVLDALSARLGRDRDTVLEDMGTYLVSHPNLEALRRLLRFGGVSFIDFLISLDDLQGRGHLAVPELDLPSLELTDAGPDRFELTCRAPSPGFGHVMVGILRAMADDYGVLVLLDHRSGADGLETVTIDVLDTEFAEGRGFELAARAS